LLTPAPAAQVFKDKFIGLGEKRLLMKFIQTVLAYVPPEQADVAAATAATAAGGLDRSEAEVLRLKAAGVRGPEAAGGGGGGGGTHGAAAAELEPWLSRPFVDFCRHRGLTARLIDFLLYALALHDAAPPPAGPDGVSQPTAPLN
jgi:hypothetical protein